ncbi:MAG TPA: amidohydrolase family protein [Dehalococcoidia bacterium]|nr:amidohydrolase family protein [Dehalococcoidia bacterium]
MAEFDILIRGGTVVDGTRVPRYRADVGIKDGRIAQIGGIRPGNGGAREVLDAAGLIVAPGFVDLHTHYDAQIQWDPYCTISGWHGVTSVVLGNCGFGFAPVRPDERDRAMLTMSRTEAIPFESMQAGMLWDWVTFPEWLDSLERIPKGVNCLSYVPVAPLMIWTMGLEAAKSRPATPAERKEMQRLLHEAMDAGACGFSTQRLGQHSVQADYDGTPMVTDTMSDEDCLALAEVLRERDEGFIQITQFTGNIKADLMFQERLAEVSGRPVLHNIITVSNTDPDNHRKRMKWLQEANERGNRLIGQGFTARTGFAFTLENWNLYDSSPAWNTATTGTVEEKMRKMADPEIREAIKREHAEAAEKLRQTQAIGGPVEELIVQWVDQRPELEQYVGLSVGDIAKAQEKDPVDAMLDLSLAADLKVEFVTPDRGNNPEWTAEMVQSPYVIPGVSDGGAHTKFFTGGSYTTDFLTWMARDTNLLSLEEAHYRLSYLPAHAAGFKDRGFLREGAPADLVVYDLAQLKCLPEWVGEVTHDFPAGEWRRVQRAAGYRWIMVNGEVTFEDGRSTGATPGKLLRHGRAG